jgi:hypothetical protein
MFWTARRALCLAAASLTEQCREPQNTSFIGADQLPLEKLTFEPVARACLRSL